MGPLPLETLDIYLNAAELIAGFWREIVDHRPIAGFAGGFEGDADIGERHRADTAGRGFQLMSRLLDRAGGTFPLSRHDIGYDVLGRVDKGDQDFLKGRVIVAEDILYGAVIDDAGDG